MTAQPPHLDASSALLREIRTSADRGFTGSITARAGSREVSVYLTGGDVYAVHSPDLQPPSGETETDEAHTRDWAYGLLAAALTWPRTKTARARKKTTEVHTFAPTPWQVVLADLSARIDDVVTAWGAIIETLAANGIAKRPASTAGTRLLVAAPEHELLTGQATIDQTARDRGLTRATVLREIAAIVLAGRGEQLHFSIAPDPAEPAELLVPESLEDPSGEWGSVEHLDIEPAPAPMLAIEAAHPPTRSTISTEDSSESEYMDHYESHPGPDDQAEALVEDDAAMQYQGLGPQEQPEQHHDELSPEATEDIEPFNGPDAVAPGEVAKFDAEHAARMTGADAFQAWLSGAEDQDDRDLREHIFIETLHTCARTARSKLQGLEAKVQEYESTLASLPRATEAVRASRAELDEARRQTDQIEDYIERLLQQEESLIEEAEKAKSFAAASGRSVQEAREAVEAAKRELARREQEEHEAAIAEARAIDTARQAVGAVNELRTGPMSEASKQRELNAQDVLGPAQRTYEAAKAVADDAHRDVLTARQSAQLAGREATQSVRMVAEMDDRGLSDVSSLITQLQHLHGRATQEVEGLDAIEIEVPEEIAAPTEEPEVVDPHVGDGFTYAAPSLQAAGGYEPDPQADDPAVGDVADGTHVQEAPALAPTLQSDLDGLDELTELDATPPPPFEAIFEAEQEGEPEGSDETSTGASWLPVHPAA